MKNVKKTKKTKKSNTQKSMKEIFKFFEKMGRQYKENHLCQVKPYLNKMKRDKYFALQMFLYYWAYEREGASQGYKVAAVKAVKQKMDNPRHNISYYYKRIYLENRNDRCNPCCDNRINNLEISQLIYQMSFLGDTANSEDLTQIIKGLFDTLKLKGLSHKIRSFFLRDIIYLNVNNFEYFELKSYLFLMPVDTWIYQTYQLIEGIIPENERPPNSGREIRRGDYDNLGGEKFNAATFIINLSLRYNVCPLLVNMGIWYFSSKIVQNGNRLSKLYSGRHHQEILDTLRNEKRLMGVFGGQRISFVENP